MVWKQERASRASAPTTARTSGASERRPARRPRGSGSTATPSLRAGPPVLPAGAVSLLARELPIGPGRRVLDLAAGTGKLTRLLVPLGADVVAVEPVAAMRSQLAAALPDGRGPRRHGRGRARSPTRRSMPSPWPRRSTGSTRREALAEIARVLRPGGGLALLWNERDDARRRGSPQLSRIMHWPTHRPYEPSHRLGRARGRRGRFTPLRAATLHLRPASSTPSCSSTGWLRAATSRPMEPAAAAGAARRGPRPRRRLRRSPSRCPTSAPCTGVTGARARRPELVGAATAATSRGGATRDPWAVLVSELMLQQTQVPRVVPRYLAFLERFPTPAACAAASAGDVVAAWAGLGYNRRAVNLHRRACVVVERARRRGSRTTSSELLALPGVGPYTARARAGLRLRGRRRPGRHQRGPVRSPGLAPAGGSTLREAQALADAARARRRGVGVGPGGARPRRRSSADQRAPRCDGVPARAPRAPGAPAASPSPTRRRDRPA